MLKRGILIILVIFFISSVSALNLNVETKAISKHAIVDIEKPAIFEFTITNNGEKDAFEIYSLVGIEMNYDSSLTLEKNETKKIIIRAMPEKSLYSERGTFSFEYTIRNSKNQVEKRNLIIEIKDLESSLKFNPKPLNPNSKKVIISLENKVSHEFKKLSLKLTSAFFDYETDLDLKKFETKELKIEINKEELKKLNAGNYLVNAIINYENTETKKDFIINFLEQEDIETTYSKEGFLIQRQEISKKNIGNIKKQVQIQSKKNLFSYLFTSTNIEPTEIKFKESGILYIWEKELIPNEEIQIIIKTNWFYPFIIIILIVLLIYFIKRYIEKDLILRKKVSFVKTKGGQFALKITLRAKAKNFIEKINITDKLPSLVKLYDKFGAITPDNIDLSNRRIEWNLETLSKDEERVFTYIIYSKIGVVGKFELPEAKATYEKNGKVKKQTSNRSFFINEPKSE